MPKLNTKKTLEQYILQYGETIGKEKWLKTNTKKSIKLDLNDLESELKNGNAIKCCACGLITTRLQHTHFKYKCTIKTLTEYKTQFPNTLLVAPNLVKNTSITLENLISKYGEVEGNKRWKSYCDKQAETNTFDYKLNKYGITEEEFNAFNKSRAVTLKNLIKKYGEDEGIKRWEAYCERQKYTNSYEYFIEQYGEDEGNRKWQNFNKGRSCQTFKNTLEKRVYEELTTYIENLKYQVCIPRFTRCV